MFLFFPKPGERSFAKLIKTYLWSTFSHERLNNLAKLSMENGIAKIIDLENKPEKYFSERSVYKHYVSNQGRIQPVSLRRRGAISVIFGSQVLLQVHYCKRDEVYFTTLLWQNSGRQNGLISRMLFPNCSKSWWTKLLFVSFSGGDRPNRPPGSAPVSNCYTFGILKTNIKFW